MHLRGNAKNYPEHLAFLREHASVLVVMFNDKKALRKSPLIEKQGKCEKLVLVAQKDSTGAEKKCRKAFPGEGAIKVLENATDIGFFVKLRKAIFGHVEEVVQK